MIGLDTNVLVRYVTQDDPAQSRLVARTLDARVTLEQPGFVCIVTVIELVWVLQAHYSASREDIAVAIEELLSDARFRVQHESAVWRALDEFSLTSSTDFADALIAALGQEQGCKTTLTFDKKAARIPGMELLK